MEIEFELENESFFWEETFLKQFFELSENQIRIFYRIQSRNFVLFRIIF